MALSLNSNSSASNSIANLNNTNGLLESSLSKLSSGIRISSPAEDAGGLSVAMKMLAAMRRTNAVSTNVSNSSSFLQVQDGALRVSGKIMDRISELKVLSQDITKNSSDRAAYNAEFVELQQQLADIGGTKFNGQPVFGGGQLEVSTTEDASSQVSIDQSDLDGASSAITSAVDLETLNLDDISSAIQGVADLRASNGAQSSRLNSAAELLTVNQTNLEAANSRIIDTDFASESTRFASLNILAQSGVAMLSQANAQASVVAKLLG